MDVEIKLLGALDYDKVERLLGKNILDDRLCHEVLEEIKKLEIARRAEIVSSAGRLSRANGNVLDIVSLSEEKTLTQNTDFSKRIIGMGHDSIIDHDYSVFALKDVSPVVEQTIIEERFSSFTIKSRREVDFSKVGFVVPDFHDKDGNIIPNNDEVKKEYINHMQMLFDTYSTLKGHGVPAEDARFVLPYCYHSNIIMGVDAHTLKNLIIKLTKGKDSNITELRKLGEELYKIAKTNMPYIIDEIDKVEAKSSDPVDSYLTDYIPKKKYKVGDKSTLVSYTFGDIDTIILRSAIMRRYQYSVKEADEYLEKAMEVNPNFKKELMKKIAFNSDGEELSQVNFQLSIPLSYAILTHLTRHRTQHIMVPDFIPNPDLEQYKIPPTIIKNEESRRAFERAFLTNKTVYDKFKNDYGIREEDLVYFTLSGNTLNVLTNMDGKTVRHILALRECTKAQWETRNMANEIHKSIKENIPSASIFETVLGPSCVTTGQCHEGRECCGRVYSLTKNK